MTTTRTHFTFRVDTWTPDGEASWSTSLALRTITLRSPPTEPPANVGPVHPSPCGGVRK
jgi:hypothetical protein